MASELFLKTDAETRPRFVEAGCRRWVIGRMRETSFFRPPDEAHEDPIALLPWARLALDAALRARAAAARPARKAAPRAPREGGAPARVSVRRAGQTTPAPRRRPARTARRRRATGRAR